MLTGRCSGVCDVHAYDDAEAEGGQGQAAGEEAGGLSDAQWVYMAERRRGSFTSMRVRVCKPSFSLHQTLFAKRSAGNAAAPMGTESRKTLPPIQHISSSPGS